MWIKKNDDLSSNSFNFIPPSGAAVQKTEVLFPIPEKQVPAHAATLAVTIKQMDTFLQPAALTGNQTINLTVDAQVTAGARLHVQLTADGSARTVTLGTKFAGLASIVAAASKVAYMTFVYDGVNFLPSVSIPS